MATLKVPKGEPGWSATALTASDIKLAISNPIDEVKTLINSATDQLEKINSATDNIKSTQIVIEALSNQNKDINEENNEMIDDTLNELKYFRNYQFNNNDHTNTMLLWIAIGTGISIITSVASIFISVLT